MGDRFLGGKFEPPEAPARRLRVWGEYNKPSDFGASQIWAVLTGFRTENANTRLSLIRTIL